MVVGWSFSPVLPQRARRPLTGTILGLAVSVIASSNALAQDSKPPFSPDEGKLFLRSAAEKARVKQKEAAKTFEEFKKSVTKEPFQNGKYIVNGDTPISTDKGLEEFYKQNVEAPGHATTEFAVMTILGVDVIWKSVDKKALTYCVNNAAADSGGFGNRYNTVVSAMADATRAWEAVADIKYVHVNAEDSNCTPANSNVKFDVRPVNLNQYLARAFFPNEDRVTSNVLIDNSAFELPAGGKLSLTGILRHELGHTLGARHEQTRPESGTCFEDNDWRGVTDYDAFSVMHYPQCNGKGDWSLTLTAQDKNGIACLYGPAPGFTIDTTICKPKQ
ncbi:matrixin family metalloprotease [Bradyrhizobium vignae]|uniref:matrixin family metalloprotease n=1 Tax=Bradyrhizobium vignae TaxID=1549949 RepID=UPI00100BD20D|nr:matrixin family metalloprotease [Bradyrhizobium vignae]RXG84336.1 matrixin family metalloprotease [Bradyrhizobium vignae]